MRIDKYKSDDYTKEDIVILAKEGGFIPKYGEIIGDYTPSLDANEIKCYLEKRGFNVIKNYDAIYNGYAITDEGIRVSTSGYCDMIKIRKRSRRSI